MNKYSIHHTPVQVQQELAARVKQLRKAKKLSQTALANKSGVSLGSLKRFEHTGQISLESLLKLANLLDVLGDFDSVFKMKEDLELVEKLFTKF